MLSNNDSMHECLRPYQPKGYHGIKKFKPIEALDVTARILECRITGRYGRVGDDLVPLVSTLWLRGRRYHNPFVPPFHNVDDPQEREYIVTLMIKLKAVLTEDNVDVAAADPPPLHRGRLLGLYVIKSPSFDPVEGLRFHLGRRLALLTDRSAPMPD